ncbi:50S ribosomal protein L17 [Candidatus Methylomirabilis sp.]|uniref:Large ribosomal subunit protein bL17 n=1 Tax=Candidatus Methylomirabilis tolerans TaxID=3123416 RepID=A0AAJ1AIJ3_9BACT|nr:50S ribosomal protein L17 [Candidatus Methylomirabilis sp.]
MRHRNAGRKLGRTTAHREMLLRNLLTSLFQYEKIVTTEAKAKELRKLADKVITLAKRGDLHARRQAAEVVQDEDILKKLFDAIGVRYKDRNGGYTRMTKLEYRMGDGAPLAAIELAETGVDAEPPAKLAKRRGRRGDKESALKSKQAEPLPAYPPSAERAVGP